MTAPRLIITAMLVNVDLYKGKVFIPTMAQTEAGFYIGTDPVEVANANDVLGIREAFKRALAHGNPLIPTPTRAHFPKPILLKYTGAKSVATYEKYVRSWHIELKDNDVEITPLRPRNDRGLE